MSASPQPAGRTPVAAAVYFALSAVGAVGTWYFNLRFTPTSDAPSYLEGWFANPASSSVAVDVIVVAVVACIFYVREAKRLGGRWLLLAGALVPLTFVIALAFTFPLFLGLREIALRRQQAAPTGT